MNATQSFAIGMPELVVIAILLLPLVLSIIALISCLRSNFQDSTHKLIWVLVILFLPLLGSILYFIISPKQRLQ
jgi:hypothetical protein